MHSHRQQITGRLRVVVCAAVAALHFAATPASAQVDGVLFVDDPIVTFLQEQQVKGKIGGASLSMLPLSGAAAQELLETLALDENASRLSNLDRDRLSKLMGKGPLPGWLRENVGWAFRNGRDLVSIEGDDYRLHVNPLLYLSAGPLRVSPDSVTTKSTTWRNTRGLRASGAIGQYVFFETRLEENQRRDPRILFNASDKTADRIGETEFDDETGVLDYMIATGSVGARTRHFEVRFGRDRNRWGYGRGSLVLSDYSTVADHLQLRTQVGPVEYVNIFASLATRRRFNRDSIIPKKYAVSHRLNVTARENLHFSIFESVMFATDSLGFRKGFDIAYLNPIIFYRAVESDRGSPDNVLLGAATMWRPTPGVQLHYELLLDELRVSRIGEKWWANKWAMQFGVRSSPLDGMLLGIEYTRIRPYTYSHREPLNAYTHFSDYLGHPAGPNSSDWHLFGIYQPVQGIVFNADVSYTTRGVNFDGINYGSDPTISNTTRVADEGIKLLQGRREKTLLINANVGYELLPFVALEAGFWFDRVSLEDPSESTTIAAPIVTLRWGLPQHRLRY